MQIRKEDISITKLCHFTFRFPKTVNVEEEEEPWSKEVNCIKFMLIIAINFHVNAKAQNVFSHDIVNGK